MNKAKVTARKSASATDASSQKDPNTGRFLPGNSGFGGRPKGSRNKLSTEFFDGLYETWKLHGVKALSATATADPKDFVKIVASLMPKQVAIKAPLEELTDGELSDLIEHVKQLIAAGTAVKVASGSDEESEPEQASLLSPLP